MALTPEDVVNKRFQSTKFREGYDQDEVDDFLDEVVAEMRRLVAENTDLREQLAQAKSASVAAPTPAAPAAPADSAAPTTGSIGIPGDDAPEESGSTNLLVLARRLHEEHVREGVEKRDALIAEGRAEAARLISEAQSEQRELVSKSELELQGLQTKIDELRAFEADYRTRLKDFIQQQLSSLNSPIVSD